MNTLQTKDNILPLSQIINQFMKKKIVSNVWILNHLVTILLNVCITYLPKILDHLSKDSRTILINH